MGIESQAVVAVQKRELACSISPSLPGLTSRAGCYLYQLIVYINGYRNVKNGNKLPVDMTREAFRGAFRSLADAQFRAVDSWLYI